MNTVCSHLAFQFFLQSTCSSTCTGQAGCLYAVHQEVAKDIEQTRQWVLWLLWEMSYVFRHGGHQGVVKYLPGGHTACQAPKLGKVQYMTKNAYAQNCNSNFEAWAVHFWSRERTNPGVNYSKSWGQHHNKIAQSCRADFNSTAKSIWLSNFCLICKEWDIVVNKHAAGGNNDDPISRGQQSWRDLLKHLYRDIVVSTWYWYDEDMETGFCAWQSTRTLILKWNKIDTAWCIVCTSV